MLIDHVTVCGDDLERLRREFAAVGIPSEYGGAHANGLTHMALAGFEDGSYVELIAPVKGADPARATGMMAGWMPLMVGNAGAGAWAVRASGIHEHAEELKSRGIEVRGPERGGRIRPDGVQLEWETAIVGPGSAGSVLPFMIEDRTERSLRVRPSANELGVRGVAAVVIGARDLVAAGNLFRQAYGWGEAAVEEHGEFGARLAHFAGTPVIVAEAMESGSWLKERVRRFGDGVVGFLLAGQKTGLTGKAQWFGKHVAWLDASSAGGMAGIVWE
jgi:hypothetical protein